MKLEAIYNAIIVQPQEIEETMYGNIVVPDLGHDKNKTGKVIAVGPGHYSATGEFMKTILQIGDIVVLPTMGFTKFEFEGNEYFIGPENQVLAKIIENASIGGFVDAIKEAIEQTEVTEQEKEYLTRDILSNKKITEEYE